MSQQVSTPRAASFSFKPECILVLGVFLAGLCACDKPAPEAAAHPETPEPIAVTLGPVKLESVEITLKIVGTLHGEEEVTIGAEVSGRIEEIHNDIGDRVAPGAELARIDPSSFQSAVNQSRMALNEALTKLGLTKLPEGDFDVEAVPTVERAKFEAANAEGKFERAQRLFNDTPPLLSQEEYKNAETASSVARSTYDVARLEARSQLALARSRQSELESAEKRLKDTFVQAPSSKSVNVAPSATFAITKRYVAGGEFVREGDPLFDMVLDDPIKLLGSVPELYVSEVKPDQLVRINVESYDQPFEGKVSRINPAIDVENRSFDIEIIVPNTEHHLRPGAFAVGLIVVGKQDAVPFVPSSAIVSFAGVDRVFSVQDGQAVEHIIRPGEQRDGLTAITSGLQDVTEVIVKSEGQLSDKSPIVVATGS